MLFECAFRAIECRLAQMNVFSRYCLTFSATDCVFSLNQQQKVYFHFTKNVNFAGVGTKKIAPRQGPTKEANAHPRPILKTTLAKI